MNKHGTVDDDRPSPFLHLGRRFGDVLPTMETDEELNWFFNRAPSAMDAQSVQGALLEGRRRQLVGTSDDPAEARHAARKIWGRLQTIGDRHLTVLQALDTERRWPGAVGRRFGHLVGVVEATVAVRAEHLNARMKGRTTAKTTVGWLEELVVARCEELSMWREDAARACGKALSAYQRARGKDGSVVPKEDR